MTSLVKYKLTSKRRPSATPEPDALQEAFDLLPKTKAPGKLVVYKPLNLKQAPAWPDVAPYRHTLLKILDVTGGLNVTQVAGVNAMRKYVADEGIAVGDSEPSEAIYRLRAMLSQIAYQKYRGRSIPRKWHQKFWLMKRMMKRMMKRKDTSEDEEEHVLVQQVHNDDAWINWQPIEGNARSSHP